MFNVVERHQKTVKGILIAITATFVVWGVSGYLDMGGDDGYVAKVGSNKIYTQDIDNAMSQNPGQPQDKMQVLFGLINRQLLINALQDNHMSASTAQLQQAIAAIPMFQTNGKFDVKKYEDYLKQSYSTSAKFEQNVNQQILIEQIVDFFKNSYFTSTTFQNKFIALLSRERNVSQYVVDTQQFYPKINVTESDINAYYKQNIAKYTVPDQVKLQYIQVSLDSLSSSIKVSDAEINQYLQDHPNSGSNEQVDASHILLTVPSGATPEQIAQIKAKAEQILAQVKANPAKFAELAKQYSQDPGSAANGGDLGFFSKGVMAKEFESAAFSLKKDQISGLVETQFGFHIIKVNEIKGNDTASLRQAAELQVQKQKAQQQLQSVIDQLNDLSYNQPDSLAPAAQKTGLVVQTSDWVAKGATQGLFANQKVQQAIFTDDVLNKHHNSEVIDLGNGSSIVVRASEYQAAKQRPISEVSGEISNALKAQQAAQMAASVGQQDLAQLQQGKLKLNFTNPQNVSLLGQSKDIDPMAVRQIFAAPAQFPSYSGAVNANGAYVIYQINSQAVDKTLDQQNQKVVDQLASQYSMMNLNAYVGSLRSQYKVSYKLDRIQGAGDTPQQPAGN